MAEIRVQSADYILPASSVNLPATLAASGIAYSSVIAAQGYHEITASVLSSQNGTLSIQRYLDAACTMPQGAAASVVITGGSVATVNMAADGTPFEFAQIAVTNSGGSTATLKNAQVILALVDGLPSTSAAANTTGGSSAFFSGALSGTVTAVKTAPGNLYGFTFQNPNTSAVYVQFFDLATGSVTLGATTPKLSYWVPGSGSYDFLFTGESKVGFATAISVAATITATGSTAPSTGILANILYK